MALIECRDVENYSVLRNDRRFKRNCKDCGEPFTTGSPRAYYCRECQAERRRKSNRSPLTGAKNIGFVKCLECGDKLKVINGSHLKRHGLTQKQYRQKHPTARLVSEDIEEKYAVLRSDRQFARNCKGCGKPFTTGSGKAYYCRGCQIKLRRKRVRLYHKKMRNSGRTKQGTFGKRYLEVENGRIRGATLLEKHVAVNSHHFYRESFNGKAPIEYEAIYLIMMYLVIVGKRKLFCGECGAELTVARQNEYYTIPAEICCKNCGLVYELDDLAELRERR